MFLKGCPLSCIWCHNPESHDIKNEIFYNSEKCISCKLCESACGKNLHRFEGDVHIFHRFNCTSCGKCAEVCCTDALELCGKEIDIDEVLKKVLADKPFYEESGGGITLSGGEPLLQFDFSLELLRRAKAEGISTAIETCGYTDKDLTPLAEVTDLWLFDIKLTDEKEHTRYTGVSNAKIMDNLSLLDKSGAKIILRCPIIPDINFSEKHIKNIFAIAERLSSVTEIHFEPYHPLGLDKAKRLGKKQAYENQEFLEKNKVLELINKLQWNGSTKVLVK